MSAKVARAALGVALLCIAADAVAYDRAYREDVIDDVSKIAYYDLTVWGGQSYTFQTSALSALGGCQPDTVLHVIDRSNDTWIATNDDCGGSLQSCLTFTAPGASGTSRTVRAIVHGYATCTRSTGTFTATGYNLSFTRTSQIFGGHILSYPSENPGWEDTDQLKAVRIMNGAGSTLSIVAWGFSTGTLRPAGWAFGGGYNGGAVMTTTGPAASSYSSKRIAVGTSEALQSGGLARLYLDDAAAGDSDGDGLGDGLEAALGTCAATPCGTGNGNPRDTDGDGLPDPLELVGDSMNLLPYWGADPLHKDVFVEIDRHTGVPTLSGTQASGAQALYAAGSAIDLDNPDGLDGVRLHIDTGTSSCSGGVCSTLYGDWGGSTSHRPSIGYIQSSTDYTDSWRLGVFRHAMATDGVGGGQTNGWRFKFGNAGAGTSGMRTFAHELGHSVGLSGHDGGNAAELNCLPNYESLMSKAFAYVTGVGFSDGSLLTLNPSSLCEQDGIGADPSRVEDHYSLEVDGYGIDWNRDGTISACNDPVRANILWADTGGCDSVKTHRTWSSASALRGDQTAVAGFDDSLVAVLRDMSTREIYFKAFTGQLEVCVPPQTQGCCPDNGAGACGTWTSNQALGGGVAGSAPGAVRFDLAGIVPLVAVFYVKDDSGTVRLYRNVINESLETGSPVSISLSTAPLLDNDEPSVLGATLHGGNIWVVYRAANDTLHQVRLNSALSVVSQGALVDSGASAFSSGRAPSLATDPDTGDLLAVITSPSTQQLQLIRNVSGTTWEVVSGAWATSLASGGGPVSLVAAPNADPPSLSVWYVPSGTPPSRLHKAFTTTSLQFNHAKLATHVWATDHRGGVGSIEWQGHVQAVANWCHEDDNGAELSDTKNYKLQHLPFADGVFDYDIESSNDWERMRDGLCPYLKGAVTGGTALCVPPGVSPSFGTPVEETCPEDA